MTRTASGKAAPSLVNHLASDWASRALRDDVRHGLTQTPKSLPPKWFYDSAGSDLFDQITRLPEYYPTRAEAQILRTVAGDIVASSGADTIVELGSGTSEKTRSLLAAFQNAGMLRRFIAFDVDQGVLSSALTELADEYDGVEISGVCGDFEHHLGAIPVLGRRLIVFLGSTIGNLTAGPRAEFLAAVADTMQPGDTFLLGTDLVKGPNRLVAAYDDSAGVTAQFNRNVLAVVNRALDADFDLAAFEHVARWNAGQERIEMWLRADAAQQVQIRDLDLTVRFEAGEEMLTEVSCKFRPDAVADELAAVGLQRTHWWTDRAGDFGLSLAVKV
jgi:L-histidine N-alpha-methyltransferase